MIAEREEFASRKRGRGGVEENVDVEGGDDGSPGDERQQTLLSRISVGARIAVYWPDDDTYYPGVVTAHLPNEWQKHVYTINYDDGEVENLDMAMEQFRVVDNGGPAGVGGAAAVASADSTSVGVRSLTVRFNNRAEVWRSPPTYYCGEDFAWPRGWIEVQRLPPEEEGGSNHRWQREFHPPRPPGRGGRMKICCSIEEAKDYIEKQEAKREKKEQRAVAREGSRSSGRRRANPNGKTPDISLVPLEGTQADLNRIMKSGGRLSDRMRDCILIGAVLARKKGTLETSSSFLGANRRVYPDLRKAFGKYIGIKQCSLCKSRVQGHWFCRIVHSHLDKPDYDGGNSTKRLVELFRCSVENLEDKRNGLLSGRGGKERERGWGEDTPLGGFESADWSMNLLSEDLLYQIASFLPSLLQLVTFCKTSRRARNLLRGSVHSEKLFRGVFLRAFGERGALDNFEGDLTWRQRWRMVRGLRGGLGRKSIVPPDTSTLRPRETVGVLPPQEEQESIFYDHPDLGDPDRQQCNGYFGMEALRLPPPPNAGPGWQAPIVLMGDFNGVRIFHSLSELLFHRDSADGGVEVNRFISVGDCEGIGQALSLIHCNLMQGGQSQLAGQGQVTPPCCFIGYASGRVAALSAMLTAQQDKYTFKISGTHHAHESEVTALSFVNCSVNPGAEREDVLFSACCAGKVYFYPNALDKKKGYSLDQSVLAFANYYDCSIFSMASTVVRSQGHSFSVLCTGDRDGNIRIWVKADDDLTGLCTRTSQKFRHIQLYKSSTHRGTGYHLVTKAMFIQNHSQSTVLITGTNNGDVRIWVLHCKGDSSREIGRGPQPVLVLRYDLMGIHNGAVELLMAVGDVLLSSGGNDGKMIGWDISTGLSLWNMRCHPGRQLEEGSSTLRSCVVDVLISGKDNSLVSLCRDGSVRQFTM